MKKRTCLTCGFLSATGFLLIVAVMVGVGAIYYLEYSQAPRWVQEPSLMADLPPEYQLSTEQQAQVSRAGYPDAFSLLFYGEAAEDGTLNPIRYEVWDYYTQDRQLVYLNGALQAEQILEAGGLTPVPTTYRPEQFQAYMSLEQVVGAAQLGSYLAVPLEKELLPEGEIFYAGGLAFGLKDDQLLYIETFIGAEGE